MSQASVPSDSVAAPQLHVAPSPHIGNTSTSTRWMMFDVLIGLLPVFAMAAWVFQWYALKQVAICVASCLLSEALFQAWRGKTISLGDGSAAVTGAILGLSLPWSAPWYVGVVGGVSAIGIGKILFGGLGQNLFNPAMVGRAVVMISFSAALSGAAYTAGNANIDALTQATPLTIAKDAAASMDMPGMWAMFLGTTNGSLGETSALAALLGGAYLLIRRSAAWQLPAGAVVGLLIAAGALQLTGSANLTIAQHMFGGAFLFGAFFIITDPVSTPINPKGRWAFGIGFGILTVLIRQFSSWPEGVMFAVLLMNSMSPLLNRWTIPKPVGGPVPK